MTWQICNLSEQGNKERVLFFTDLGYMEHILTFVWRFILVRLTVFKEFLIL